MSISDGYKDQIVRETLVSMLKKENGNQKLKLFLVMPQPFLADFVCKNKSVIKEELFKQKNT